MKISGRRSVERQGRFWPQPINTMAETRNHCGEFAETLTALVSGGQRLKTDGTADYCPDVWHSEIAYSECKSVGKNGAAIIYEGRREKDRRFTRPDEGMAERMLFYWFWRHKANAKAAADVDALRGDWARSLLYGVVLPFPVVDKLAGERPLKVLNRGTTRGGKANGYGSLEKGYRDGRFIPMTTLRAACDYVALAGPLDIGGATVMPVPIYFIGRFVWLLPNAYQPHPYQSEIDAERKPKACRLGD